MQFEATTEKGKLAIATPSKWKDYLLGFPDGTKMILDIDRKKNKRSLSQNAFLWLYYGVIENETGQPANDIHEWAKRMFLPPKFITVMGKELKIPASTTDLSKHDFSNYLDRIASETGIPIPDMALAGYTPKDPGYLTEKSQIAYPDEKNFKEPTI